LGGRVSSRGTGACGGRAQKKPRAVVSSDQQRGYGSKGIDKVQELMRLYEDTGQGENRGDDPRGWILCWLWAADRRLQVFPKDLIPACRSKC